MSYIERRLKRREKVELIWQYLSVYISNIVDATGDIIDTGFTNSLGINEICIFGIICSIHGLCYTLCCYGTYVFRITGKNAKECLFLTGVISSILSLVLVLVSPFLWHVWYIEPQLRHMLRTCIVCLAFSEVPRAVSIFLLNYMQYTSQGSLCTKLLVLFYIFMFLCDIVAVFVFKSLPLVILGTGLSNVFFDVIAYFKSGVNKLEFNFKEVKGVVETGFGYFLERIFSRLSLSVYEASATYLGTYEFAVFTVAYKLSSISQVMTNSLQVFFVSNIRKANKVNLTYAKELYAKVRWVCIAMYIVPIIIGMFIIKGELSATNFIIPIFEIYMAYFSGVYYIMNYSVFSVINDKKRFVLVGVVRLCSTLVLICASLIIKQYALYILMLYFVVVYFVTGLYMKGAIKKCIV